MGTTLLRTCDHCRRAIPSSAPLVQFTASAIVRASSGEEGFAQAKEPIETCGGCAIRAFQSLLDQAVRASERTAAAAHPSPV